MQFSREPSFIKIIYPATLFSDSELKFNLNDNIYYLKSTQTGNSEKISLINKRKHYMGQA